MVRANDRNDAAEAAMARVLAVERGARDAIARARVDAQHIGEAARAAARRLNERTEQRVCWIAAERAPPGYGPSQGRSGPARFAVDAVDLRDPGADGRDRQLAGDQRERPHDHRDRRAVQHRDRDQVLLPHAEAGLGDRGRRRLLVRRSRPTSTAP